MEIERSTELDGAICDGGIRMLYSGFVKTDSSWKQEPMYAPFSRLYYVTDGSGVLVGENETLPLEAGYVYLAPCGAKCGFYGTDSVTKLFFHVNLVLSPDGYDAFEKSDSFDRLPRSVSHIERMKRWYFGNDSLDRFKLRCELENTACEFLSRSRHRSDKVSEYSREVSDALRFIKENLTASLTVESVATAALCSRSTLSVMFKREIGVSVAKYIEDLIMSEAQNMLLYDRMSVGEVSERLGFCDQFYFSRRFTQRFSVSPNMYKKSLSQIR